MTACSHCGLVENASIHTVSSIRLHRNTTRRLSCSGLYSLRSVLVGLPFFVFGLDFFLHFLTMPTPEFPEAAKGYIGAIGSTGYMKVVKVLELVGGALILSGRLVPLGLVLVTPVAVNIAYSLSYSW